MNKALKALLALSMIGTLAACSTDTGTDSGVANPWTEYDTQEEAQDDGFEFEAPFTIDDYTAEVYRSMKAAINNVEEVDYKDGDDNELTLRKGECTEEEISGDYNTYANSEEADVNGNTVTIKGSGDTWSLATWTNGDYSYSVYSTKGLAKETLLAIVDGIE